MQSPQSATTPGILTLVKILIWVLQRKCSPDTGSICILYAKEATLVRLCGTVSILVGTRNQILQKIGD